MKRFPRLLFLTCIALLGLSACSADDAPVGSAPPASSASASAAPSASQSATEDSAQPGASATPEIQTLADGGEKIFAGKRYVALYGAPASPSLGALGEQAPAAAAQRVKNLAAEYQPYSEEAVVPAFEIITTVASSAPGADGDYSDESTIENLKPLLNEAEKNDIYVVLDFQPGRSDFLSQIKQYEEVLKRPNVGVGIDPEWRLAPDQVHLQQIGSVDAGEINESLDYLAELTRDNGLPQKMVVLHQFTPPMITNRETLNTSYPELALTLHADGHGSTNLKTEGYAALLRGLDAKIKPSWKNFYDEDAPMLTPEQTYALTPKPWVVTYQ